MSRENKSHTSSKLTRVIWSINGYLLFATLVIMIGLLASEFIRYRTSSFDYDKGVVVGQLPPGIDSVGQAVQHLEYGSPTKIEESDYYYSPVYVMDTEYTEEALVQMEEIVSSAGDISRSRLQARVNVIFFKNDLSDVHTLVPGSAYIHDIAGPRRTAIRRGTEMEYPIGSNILYQMAVEDSNNDNRLNEEDEMAYYMSDSSGRNLMQITPDSLNISSYWFLEGQDKIVFESEGLGESVAVRDLMYRKKTRRLYTYDLVNDVFEPFDELQRVFESIVTPD